MDELSRAEKLDLIYDKSHADFKGIAGERWPVEYQGKRTILTNDNGATTLSLLEQLSDEQIAEKLPFALSMTGSEGCQVHALHGMSGRDAYDETQTNPRIKDGDVLDLGGGNVGILVEAWPVLVAGEIEGFHRLGDGASWASLDDGKYLAAFAKAKQLVSRAPADFLDELNSKPQGELPGMEAKQGELLGLEAKQGEHAHYNKTKFPTFMLNHGNWDIYANKRGNCAAIPTDAATAIGCKATHFGDLAYVQATLPKEFAQWEERQAALASLAPPDGWEPAFSRWRHGGWYVDNVRYPSGACGCVSNNYDDGKWRIACDDRRTELGAPGDFTFATRDAAARAEYTLAKALERDALTPPKASEVESDEERRAMATERDRIRSLSPRMQELEIREDVVASFSLRWGMTHDEVAEVYDGCEFLTKSGQEPLSAAMAPELAACSAALPSSVEIVTTGRHVGTVSEVTGQYAMQSAGRGKVVAHELARFDVSPKVGEVLDVQYKGGKAVVAEPAQSLARGRE